MRIFFLLLSATVCFAKTNNCEVKNPIWYYQAMNKENSTVHSETAGPDGITIHHWYISPKDDAPGNHLSLIYEEDPRQKRLTVVDELLKSAPERFGSFYLTCGSAPERYFFSSGYYYSRFVMTNYATCPDSCVVRAALAFDPKVAASRPASQNTVQEALSNPNIQAAFQMIANKGKKEDIEKKIVQDYERGFQPIQPRQPRTIKGRQIKLGNAFDLPKGVRLGQFKRVREMPDEVLKGQLKK